MQQLDLPTWVANEPEQDRREFRQAMHLILRAVANSESLTSVMVMKGGILLAIRYKSSRFTKDVDFSTSRRMQEVNVEGFVEELNAALRTNSLSNEYGLSLIVQRYVVNPKGKPDANFPTLQLSVGYANKARPREIERLRAKNSAKTIQIDYSFNEWASEVEVGQMDGGTINMYAYHDLMAEKIRSVLQQPIRKRDRFQDIYDLFLLLGTTEPTDQDRASTLEKLRSACFERQVPIFKNSMRQVEVVLHSQRGYEIIAPQIKEPPAFEVAYSTVREFFESLPWSDDEIDAPRTPI